MAKYTINFAEEFEKRLAELAKEKGTTKADIVRRAITYYAILDEERAKGNKIVIQDEENGTEQRLVIR